MVTRIEPEADLAILGGKKGLVTGIANDQSIAYGCAKAFRRLGAEIAVTYLNEKARSHVEPLAQALDAEILMPLDVQVEGVFGERVHRHRPEMGAPGFLAAFDRLRTER